MAMAGGIFATTKKCPSYAYVGIGFLEFTVRIAMALDIFMSYQGDIDTSSSRGT